MAKKVFKEYIQSTLGDDSGSKVIKESVGFSKVQKDRDRNDLSKVDFKMPLPKIPVRPVQKKEEEPLKLTDDKEAKYTTGTIPRYTGSSKDNILTTMQMFGLPYQFLDTTDQRSPKQSKTLGRKYIENIIMDAPIVCFIPGVPKYLPGVSKQDKVGVTNAFMNLANGNFKELKEVRLKASEVRLYDFQADYINYMSYVNMLCRSCSGFLEIGGTSKYRINGSKVSFFDFDWKNYTWSGKKYSSAVATGFKKVSSSILSKLKKKVKSIKSKSKVSYEDKGYTKDAEKNEELESALVRSNYVQFYAEPTGGSGQQMSNTTQPSMFKSALDSAGSAVKDISFLLNSGSGTDLGSNLQKLGDSAIGALEQSLGSGLGSVNESAGSIVSRLLSSAKSVIKGENIAMPDIWTGSDISNSFDVTIHLKAPYGNVYSLYVDVIVPMMHLIALAYPHAGSANSYGSPWLIKYYQKGVSTCNLGIVSNFVISKDVVPESRNTDGLVTEVDVRLSIVDLYSTIALSPPEKNMFRANVSLVDFLASTCGISILETCFKEKAAIIFNQYKHNITDIPGNVVGNIMQKVDEAALSFFGL